MIWSGHEFLQFQQYFVTIPSTASTRAWMTCDLGGHSNTLTVSYVTCCACETTQTAQQILIALSLVLYSFLICSHAFIPVSREVLGHNWPKSYCFQVQLVTCWHQSVCLYQVEVCCIDSSQMIDSFPRVLNFNWFICNYSSCWFPLFVALYTNFGKQDAHNIIAIWASCTSVSESC